MVFKKAKHRKILRISKLSGESRSYVLMLRTYFHQIGLWSEDFEKPYLTNTSVNALPQAKMPVFVANNTCHYSGLGSYIWLLYAFQV